MSSSKISFELYNLFNHLYSNRYWMEVKRSHSPTCGIIISCINLTLKQIYDLCGFRIQDSIDTNFFNINTFIDQITPNKTESFDVFYMTQLENVCTRIYMSTLRPNDVKEISDLCKLIYRWLKCVL